MPPKPRKALRMHTLVRAREAPRFAFCMVVGGRINQQLTATGVLLYTEGTEAKITLAALLALRQTHSQSEARVTRLLSWAAEATEQRFPGFSLPPAPP